MGVVLESLFSVRGNSLQIFLESPINHNFFCFSLCHSKKEDGSIRGIGCPQCSAGGSAVGVSTCQFSSRLLAF